MISSRWTVFYKFVLPLFWVGLVCIFAWSVLASEDPVNDPVALLFFVPFLAVFSWLYYKLIWVLADSVAENADHLLVRRRSTELRIPYADFLNVGYASSSQPPRLSLRLRKAGALGDEILFIPVQTLRWNLVARNPIVESLIQRIDSARRTFV